MKLDIFVASDGTIRYRKENGMLHREDGPAVQFISGKGIYWLNGKWHSKEKWERKVLKLKLERLKDL